MFDCLSRWAGGVPSLTSRPNIAFVIFVAFAVADAPARAEVPLTTLRHETRELLRHEATAKPGPVKDEAIAALCDLYVVLRSDERYATSDMLRGDAAKVRRRLLGIARRRESRLERENVSRPSSLSAEVDSAISAALAQDTPDLGRALEGQGGGVIGDNGWQLVELIQRVVEPDFWEPRGGPGAIRYFAMRRVLVVRATSDVHEQVRELLMALR